jgi:hypothetical protein
LLREKKGEERNGAAAMLIAEREKKGEERNGVAVLREKLLFVGEESCCSNIFSDLSVKLVRPCLPALYWS